MSEDDEDWFERGVRELSEGSEDAEESDSDVDETGRDDSDPPRTDALGSTDLDGAADEAERSEPSGPGDTPSDDPDPFRGTGSESESGEETDPFAGGDPDLFDDEGFGGLGDEAFDEEPDSDLPRINLGIEGLDGMIQGGVPERHLLTVIGGAGTGKTTFGLQFLAHGLERGEKGVFITLEQSRQSILATADEWGWGFSEYDRDDELAVLDIDPIEMANSLDNIQAELPALIEEFGAERLVLDSVSLLEMMYDDQAKRRTEVFDFTRSLKQIGVTTFVTSEANESTPYASRNGIIEYLTDGVFILQYVRGEGQETRLAVEIQKIRNTNHSRAQKPYEITDEGLSVYQQASIF